MQSLKQNLNLILFTPFLLIFCFFSGCFSQSKESVDLSSSSAIENVTESAGANANDALSYGLITSKVQKDVTTQQDIIELFGGPNITTIDAQGNETWVYEKTSTESQIQQDVSRTGQSEAKRLDFFFGLGFYGEGQKSGTSKTKSSARFVHSIKTLTVIIKFNKDKTVKEYSARVAHF